jgi:hypothetical protein
MTLLWRLLCTGEATAKLAPSQRRMVEERIVEMFVTFWKKANRSSASRWQHC